MAEIVEQKPQNKGLFKPGHQKSVGNPGPWGQKFLTQGLTSDLHECDTVEVGPTTEWLIEQAESIATNKKGITKAKIARFRRLLRMIVDRGIAGDMRAAEFIFDRVEGKPRQQIDVTGLESMTTIELVRQKVTIINGNDDSRDLDGRRGQKTISSEE